VVPRSILTPVIDLHSHILPGLDDGVATLEEARELARRSVAEGVTAIAATPHVREDYPTTAEQMEAGVEELRVDFVAQGIEVEILRGAEIAIDRLPGLNEEELSRYTLAQSGKYLLLEFPDAGFWRRLTRAVLWVRGAGLVPVLGHPERNREVQVELDRLEPLVTAGAIIQVTAASLDGRLGRSSQRTAQAMLKAGLVHLLASDAHGPSIRQGGLAAAADAVGDKGLARYLTEEVPRAIVAGEPVPERSVTRKWLKR
jgi:protein-tyrosine phosphatase